MPELTITIESTRGDYHAKFEFPLIDDEVPDELEVEIGNDIMQSGVSYESIYEFYEERIIYEEEEEFEFRAVDWWGYSYDPVAGHYMSIRKPRPPRRHAETKWVKVNPPTLNPNQIKSVLVEVGGAFSTFGVLR